MIFAIATDEQALSIFADEIEAVSTCEGVDVEAADWLFWASDGSGLVPEFLIPNKKGLFSVTSGTYRLIAGSALHQCELSEALDFVVTLELNAFFKSLDEVRIHLSKANGLMSGT